MTENEAKELVRETLGAAFNRDAFARLLDNMLKTPNSEKAFAPLSGQMIRSPYRGVVCQYERIGQYADPEGEIIDILVVRLQKPAAMRARAALRGFVAHYLKNRDNPKTGPKSAALVAFHFPGETSWRFSFIRMRYDLVVEHGKIAAKSDITPARRYSFLVGKEEKTHTAQRQLAGLLQAGDPPTLRQLESAFSVEPVTARFFKEYRALYERVCQAVKSALAEDKSAAADFNQREIQAPDFAKKLLGQIVFLYFLQRKGWMGVPPKKKWGEGDSEFLRKRFDGRNGENFYAKILQPLFYEALRQDRPPADLYSPLNCRIPFLNGGLFTPLKGHNWQECGVDLPDELFSNDEGEGVLDVLDRYNFTIAEDEPAEREVAVDPEMLGKIFENLIEANERKGGGAFYTPRDIVHFMCQESLRQHLAGALENSGESPPAADLDEFIRIADLAAENEVRRLNKGKAAVAVASIPKSVRKIAATLDDLLQNVRVCDPAVGSGAFMVGMMHEIVRLRAALAPAVAESADKLPTAYDLKYHAIANSLYGADKDGGAVEIAQLRLWLSLVVDEENPRRIRPLPNLNYKIMRGDTLTRVERDVFNNEQFQTLENLKAQFFDESGPTKKAELEKDIDARLRKLLPAGCDFDLQTAFGGPFLKNGGFDIVIGNPPYVRQESIPADEKDRLQKAYKDGTTRTSDLFAYFYLRGLNILRPGGVHTFICSNGWLYSEYGAKLEETLLHTADIASVYNSEIERQFSTAAINTVISVMRNRNPDGESQTRFVVFRDALEKSLNSAKARREIIRTNAQLKKEGMLGNKYVGGKWGGRFLRAPDIYSVVLDKGKDKFVRLEQVASIQRGISTGVNDFFHLDENCVSQWGIEGRFMRPLITSATECAGIVINPAVLPYRLFVCPENRAALRGTNALRYIDWGESEGYHEKKSVKSRPLWYSLREQPEFDCLLLRFRHERVWTLVNESPEISGGDTMFVARYRERRAVYPGNCYANSTLFAFFAEILARVNFGEGIAVTNGPELKAIPFPNAEILCGMGRDELSAFEEMKSRPVRIISEEVALRDRRELDAPFFALLGLTVGEIDGLYEGMTKLVSDRKSKAATIRAVGD